MKDRTIRCASRENDLRHQLGERLEVARKARGMSIREFAAAMGTSLSQAQRVLHKTVGGSPTLMTIIKACDVLGVPIGLFGEGGTDRGSQA